MTAEQLKELENDLWEAADHLRANSKLTATEYTMPVLGLIFLRQASNRFDQIKAEVEPTLPTRAGKRMPLTKEMFLERAAIFLPEKAHYDYLASLPKGTDIGAAIDNAMRLIEGEYEQLSGVLPKTYTLFEKDLLEAILRIFNKEVLKTATGDVFGKIYEYFLNEFAKKGAQEGGEFFTPYSLVSTIVNFIEPDHGTILDPACGSAGMFVQSGYFIERLKKDPNRSATFFGQEKTSTNTNIAKMNLAVHGLEGLILEGNTFYEDKHELFGQCDFVMANPPFNVDKVDKDREVVKNDPRLPFGLPKTDNANYLWIQYFYSYLNETGRAGFVMASSASDAGHSEKLIREQLVKTGAVDIMVAIGNNFFYTRSLPCTLWFYDRAKEKITEKQNPVRNKNTILMLDARKIFRKVSTTINDFSPEQLENLTAIVKLYRGDNQYMFNVLRPRAEIIDAIFHWAGEDLDEHSMLLTDTSNMLQTICDEVSVENQAEFYSNVQTLKGLIVEIQNEYLKLKEEIVDIEDFNTTNRGLFADSLNKFNALHNIFLTVDSFHHRMLPVFRHIHVLQKRLITEWKRIETEFELRRHKMILQHKPGPKLGQIEVSFFIHTHDWRRAHQLNKDSRWLIDKFIDGKYQDVEGLCKVVGLAAFEEKEYSLSPGRHVGVMVEDEINDDYAERIVQLHNELNELDKEAAQLMETIKNNSNSLLI